MIEKLGITENTPGWEDEAKREMLDTLIKVYCWDWIPNPNGDKWMKSIIEKATGLTWAQVKERIG